MDALAMSATPVVVTLSTPLKAQSKITRMRSVPNAVSGTVNGNRMENVPCSGPSPIKRSASDAPPASPMTRKLLVELVLKNELK